MATAAVLASPSQRTPLFQSISPARKLNRKQKRKLKSMLSARPSQGPSGLPTGTGSANTLSQPRQPGLPSLPDSILCDALLESCSQEQLVPDQLARAKIQQSVEKPGVWEHDAEGDLWVVVHHDTDERTADEYVLIPRADISYQEQVEP